MSFPVGSLVRTRGREWVVLPDTDDELIMVRPLGGTDAEITGILTDLEVVEPATFAPPDPRAPRGPPIGAVVARRASARFPLQCGPVP